MENQTLITENRGSGTSRADTGWRTALFLIALVTVLYGSYDRTLGWNDMSRLGAVEVLVDQGVDWIDHSTLAKTSQDRVYINQHYYSHQPPVLTYLLSGIYFILQKSFGLSATAKVSSFCYWMNLMGAGLGFVFAVLGMFRLSRICGLSNPIAFLFSTSLGFCTIAVSYARSVNSHIIFLAIVIWAIILLEKLEATEDSQKTFRYTELGILAGFALSLDQASGGVFLLAVGFLVAYDRKKSRDLIWFALGIAPWAIAYAVLNWRISGNLLPIASKPEYFVYPNSPWKKDGLTGHYFRRTLWEHLNYGWLLVFSDRGIISNNIPVWLAFPCLFFIRKTKIILALSIWGIVSVATYTLMSSNVAGTCLSVRWFIPLLGIAYYVMAKGLQEYRELVLDFSLLSVFGAILSFGYAWKNGPWVPIPRDSLYVMIPITLASWAGLRLLFAIGVLNPIRHAMRRGTQPLANKIVNSDAF